MRPAWTFSAMPPRAIRHLSAGRMALTRDGGPLARNRRLSPWRGVPDVAGRLLDTKGARLPCTPWVPVVGACRDAAWVGQESRSTPAVRLYQDRQGATTTRS